MAIATRTVRCPACAEDVSSGPNRCPHCQTPLLGASGKGILCRKCDNMAPLDASTCPSCGQPLGVPGGVWVAIPVILLSFIGGCGALASVLAPSLHQASEQARQRACYANMKTIAGAVEMYNLDYSTSVEDLDREMLLRLREKGILPGIPQCPSKPEDGRNYEMDAGEVRCRVHGKAPAIKTRRMMRTY